MMELLWYSYAFSGRGEHETSLLEPVPPGETLYQTKKPPDTTRIIPAFLRDGETYLIAHAARPPGGGHEPATATARMCTSRASSAGGPTLLPSSAWRSTRVARSSALSP